MINNEIAALLKEACTLALSCRRGSFYPDKNFGIQLLFNEFDKNTQAMLAYAQMAAAEIDGLYIKSARKTQDGVLFTVLTNDEEGQVIVKL